MRLLKTGFLILFISAVSAVFAQTTSPWWLSLEKGKKLFRSGAYGDALMAFDDARRSRWDAFTRMENDLILALSTPQLRSMGDSLEWVEK